MGEGGKMNQQLAELDEIVLTGLKVHGKHGVFEDEKIAGHDFLIDARLGVDLSEAGVTDNLAATVNYGEIAETIVKVVSGKRVDLIEHLAHQILTEIFASQPLVRHAEITINKPTAPITHAFQNVNVKLRKKAPRVLATVALGSNLGQSKQLLHSALQNIKELPRTKVLATSSIYETVPVSEIAQPDYFNAALALETELSPWQLLKSLQRIEQTASRVRKEHWGPRTLDLDLITWGEISLNSQFLTLPHPRAHERAFVLVPLLEVQELMQEAGYQNQLVLTGLGTVTELFKQLQQQPKTIANDLSGIRKAQVEKDFGLAIARIELPAQDLTP